MKANVSLNKGGLITVPKWMRQNLELSEGDELQIRVDNEAEFIQDLMSNGRVYVPAIVRHRVGIKVEDSVEIRVEKYDRDNFRDKYRSTASNSG